MNSLNVANSFTGVKYGSGKHMILATPADLVGQAKVGPPLRRSVPMLTIPATLRLRHHVLDSKHGHQSFSARILLRHIPEPQIQICFVGRRRPCLCTFRHPHRGRYIPMHTDQLQLEQDDPRKVYQCRGVFHHYGCLQRSVRRRDHIHASATDLGASDAQGSQTRNLRHLRPEQHRDRCKHYSTYLPEETGSL